MKILFLSLIGIFYGAHARASTNTDIFCKDYLSDQKRIAKVKRNGWIDGSYSKASKEWMPSGGDSTKYLYGCLDLKWKTQLYENLCLGQNKKIELPKVLLFYFDGYGDFKPQAAKDKLGAVNVLGSEPSGFMQTGIMAMTYVQEKINFNDDNFEPLFKDENIRTAKRVLTYSWKRDIEFHYHSGSGTDQIQGEDNALACYSQIQNDLSLVKGVYPDLARPKVMVAGYSNGGARAISFVNYFTQKKNSRIDALLTVDPVPKADVFIKNKISSEVTVFQINKKENIGQSYNFYQTSDVGVLAGVIAIHGSQVAGVDQEQKLPSNHVYIPTEERVLTTFADELVLLIKSTETP